MASARRLYRLSLGLGALGIFSVVVAALVVSRTALTGSDMDRLAATCGHFLLPDMSLASILVLALALLGSVAALRGGASFVRRLRDQRRFIRALRWSDGRIASTPVRIVDEPAPQAFCAGYLRPRIYLSRGAVTRLSVPELDAVLAHEAHHRARRDPLRLLVMQVLADALFFLPALRRLSVRYGELAELAADEAATRPPHEGRALASALLAFSRGGSPVVGVGIAPERVDHLLGARPRWEVPVSLLAASLLTLVIVLAAALVSGSGMAGAAPSLPVLANQVCMLLMTLAPVACVAALVGRGLRRLGFRSLGR